MEETNNLRNEFWVVVIYYIFSAFMVAFSILLIITYSKDKYFHKNVNDSKMNKVKLYPCYFNIFYCTIISLSNAIRLIPYQYTTEEYQHGNPTLICKVQSFLASLFDQLLVSLMTIYSIINYLSVFKIYFYKNHLKAIYLSLIFAGFLISLALTIIYVYKGVSGKDILCYIHTRDNLKIISNVIYISLLFIITLFCLISLIYKLNNMKKEFQINGNSRKVKRSLSFLKRFILALIINIIAFTYIILLIIKVFPRGSYKDILYMIVCLMVEIFFTINKPLYRAFMRLITCNKVEKYKDKDNIDLNEEFSEDDRSEEENEDEDDVDTNY
jgi:hypothetical protein